VSTAADRKGGGFAACAGYSIAGEEAPDRLERLAIASSSLAVARRRS
jgi:hypothetical protein